MFCAKKVTKLPDLKVHIVVVKIFLKMDGFLFVYKFYKLTILESCSVLKIRVAPKIINLKTYARETVLCDKHTCTAEILCFYEKGL